MQQEANAQQTPRARPNTSFPRPRPHLRTCTHSDRRYGLNVAFNLQNKVRAVQGTWEVLGGLSAWGKATQPLTVASLSIPFYGRPATLQP